MKNVDPPRRLHLKGHWHQRLRKHSGRLIGLQAQRDWLLSQLESVDAEIKAEEASIEFYWKIFEKAEEGM